MSRLKKIVMAGLITSSVTLTGLPTAGAVVNGSQAGQNEVTRATVGLQFPSAKQGYVENCTGTVVAPEWILTADHCVPSTDTVDRVSVVATGTTYGNKTLDVQADGGARPVGATVFGQSQIVRPSTASDIALVKLPRAIQGIAPAPVSSMKHAPATEGEIYGWGIASGTSHTPGEKLFYAPSQIVSSGAASDLFKDAVTSGEFGKYTEGNYYYTRQLNGSNTIVGDSGGPFSINNAVAGVTSQLVIDNKTEKTIATLSTSTSDKIEWIKSTVNAQKPSQNVDVAAGEGGVAGGKNVLPFTVVNTGRDNVETVNVEVSPPEGHDFPIDSVLVVGEDNYKPGQATTFKEKTRIPLAAFTPETAQGPSRSFTVQVPVNLAPSTGVQMRIEMPAAVDGGQYRILSYVVPGVRPASYALDATNTCGTGADRDNCATVTFSKDAAKDAVVSVAGFDTSLKVKGASAETTPPATDTETTTPPAPADTETTTPDTPSDTETTTPNTPVTDEPTTTPGTPDTDVTQPSRPADDSTGVVDPVDEHNVDPGDIDVVGRPDTTPESENVVVDSQPSPVVPETNGPSPTDVNHPVPETTIPTVEAEQPAASQRVLADTGVSMVTLLTTLGLAFAAVAGIVFIPRRKKS